MRQFATSSHQALIDAKGADGGEMRQMIGLILALCALSFAAAPVAQTAAEDAAASASGSAAEAFWQDSETDPDQEVMPAGATALPAEADAFWDGSEDAGAQPPAEAAPAEPDSGEPESNEPNTDALEDGANALAGAARIKPRAAVFTFDVRGNLGIADAGASIAEWMLRALAETGEFTLMERVLLSKVLEEQELQSSFLVDEESMAAEAGKLYGVDAIVSGTVIEWAGTISIVARLVDTSTGEILSTAEVKTRRRDAIPDQINQLALRLAKLDAPTANTSSAPLRNAPEPAPVSDRLQGNPGQLRIDLLPGQRFRFGEAMRFRISTAKPGHLLVFNLDASGELSKLYPFPCYQPGCDRVWLQPGRPITVPGRYDGIELTAGEPAGPGYLIAILSQRPLAAGDLALVSGADRTAPKLRWSNPEQPAPAEYSVAIAPYHIAAQ